MLFRAGSLIIIPLLLLPLLAGQTLAQASPASIQKARHGCGTCCAGPRGEPAAYIIRRVRDLDRGNCPSP
jgi:hypothetical protein